jgi:tRNA/rRNA methyltransferase
MKTMGLSRLRWSIRRAFPDDEAMARAAGADDILANAAQVCRSVWTRRSPDCVFAVALSARHRNLGPKPCGARGGARHPQSGRPMAMWRLVFGNETAGLSNDEVQRCQRTVFIPANPDYTSLNLGSAVQLLCYELRLAAFDGQPPVVTKAFLSPRRLATNDDVERFYAHLERVMVTTGFLDPQHPQRSDAQAAPTFRARRA